MLVMTVHAYHEITNGPEVHVQDPVTQLPAIMVSATDCTGLASLRHQLEDTLEREIQ